MNLEYTKDELNTLKQYKNQYYKAINQLLISNCETDLSMMSMEAETEVEEAPYDRKNIIENIDRIKNIYRLCQKYFYNTKHKQEVFYRGTSMAEVDRLRQEPFIDRIWTASERKQDAEDFYALKLERPVLIEITVDEEVPFVDVDKILNSNVKTGEIVISPFTKIKSITEIESDNKKIFKTYSITIEKQKLEELTEKEREGLFNYILENSYSIKRKLEECINLESENTFNYENIRKLEEAYAKLENEQEEKEISPNYSDAEREEDYKDLERVEKELNQLKSITNNVYEVRKENINFINMWKRNVAVYLIAECKAIEDEFEGMTAEFYTEDEIIEIEEAERKALEEEQSTIDENVEAVSLEADSEIVSEATDIPTDDVEEDSTQSETSEETEVEDEEPVEEQEVVEEVAEEKEPEPEFIDANPMHQRVMQESKENIDSVTKLIHNIENLISKQQNFARIAGNVDSQYSALNNAFDMRKVAETLLLQVKAIDEKIKNLCSSGDNDKINLNLELISKTNIEISTLINYLNNPRILSPSSRATRFDEIAIIEENALKRGIAEKIKCIRGEGEIKKLKDDQEIIEGRTGISRFIGMFTGRNKLDELMLEQIDIRKEAIRNNLMSKMRLTSNYSIHELMAEIVMFVEENDDDEVVEKEVAELKAIAAELKKNYVIVDSKVQSIIQRREGSNLPLDKRISKIKIIEAETFSFLRKYNYDVVDGGELEPEYQDTMANEIARIVDYINTSKII
ncbi:MAG: hypothetical protein K6D97_00525 [Clostridia bacterium]|nr:hypothetical protein [Clostridia bacterium]